MEKYFGKAGWAALISYKGRKTTFIHACGPATQKVDARNEIQELLRM
jgi:hypothetical protein